MINNNNSEQELKEWESFISDSGPQSTEFDQNELRSKTHKFGTKKIEPNDDESLLSWIIRQVHEFDMNPIEFLESESDYWSRSKGINLDFLNKPNLLLRIDVLPVNNKLNKIMKLRGINADLRSLQLNLKKYYGKYLEKKLNPSYLRNLFYYDLRYCPLCWKNDKNPYFRLIWRILYIQSHFTKFRIVKLIPNLLSLFPLTVLLFFSFVVHSL